MTSGPHIDSELLFLTDSAYLSLFDEQPTRRFDGKQKHDGLFLERLDSFIEGQIRDIAAFAEREQHPFDEIRKLVAVSHAKFLFSQNDPASNSDFYDPSVRSILARLSSSLQKLQSTAGIEALLLAVAPPSVSVPTTSSANTSAEVSWIGGTELGKEFWMGLKGGGVVGVRTFRAKCHAAEGSITATPVPAHPRSGDIKAELNAAVRHALRIASGNPTAEMRWTRPAALEDAYNVRVRGWPVDIMRRNPSDNPVRENKRLLECIRSGSLRFVPRGSAEWDDAALELSRSAVEGSRNIEDSQRDDNSQSSASAPPIASSLQSSTTRHDRISSRVVTPPFSHLAATVAHTEAAKRRPAEWDEEGRYIRRRTDSETG